MDLFKRQISIQSKETFFLWGPRQSGKTWLLKALFPEAPFYNLLESEVFAKYSAQPHLFREELRQSKTRPPIVIVDEVQKIPALLDEIHTLIENDRMTFGLCGSSARKVRRGHANLLGGRAIRHQLFGFVSAELGDRFDLERICNCGYLPRIYLSDDPQPLLKSYVADYLKEEIAAEGLVRNLPSFSDFLRVVALSDTEIVNYSNIASDCGVSRTVVQNYYEILEDTMLGYFVPAYTRRQKRRVIHAPKFYSFDVGVVNYLSLRGKVAQGSELFGKAFENFIFHELRAYAEYSGQDFAISYWRLSSGGEVDFIINDMQFAIEAKAVSNVQNRDLKCLRELKKDNPKIKKLIVVSLVDKSRLTDDGCVILSVSDFLTQLWRNELLG